jgi:hypothetical protein
MAGTIVSDVLQDGAGNSTATTNAISGSAKAWAQFTCTSGGTLTVNASYNISSITRNSAGQYTASFTNSLADGKYSVSGGSSGPNTANYYGLVFSPFTISSAPYYQAPTASSFVFATL